MSQVEDLLRNFNDRITSKPGVLPDLTYVLDLSDGPVLVLEGGSDQLVEMESYVGEVDCTIKCSFETLDDLLAHPEKAQQLVFLSKIKFDNLTAMLELAKALKVLYRK